VHYYGTRLSENIFRKGAVGVSGAVLQADRRRTDVQRRGSADETVQGVAGIKRVNPGCSPIILKKNNPLYFSPVVLYSRILPCYPFITVID
jgi:hypothetical protein